MSSTEAPISITAKTPASTLVTVRANNGEELDQLVETSLAAIQSAVQELEAAVRGTNAAVPPNPQVASISAAFNATPVDSFDAPSPAMGAGSRA